MWGNDPVEAGGIGGERICLRQNKESKSLWNPLPGSRRQDSRVGLP